MNPADHPQDICFCGDYRRDHKDGVGACNLNGLGHGGPGPCLIFRVSKRYETPPSKGSATQPDAPREASKTEGRGRPESNTGQD